MKVILILATTLAIACGKQKPDPMRFVRQGSGPGLSCSHAYVAGWELVEVCK